ncbi:MAG: hypothetical protein KatS3mg076_1757 [Candidatus Binatia bacterium]|nr:MAG: hypothetical protein KatS3mg076_1757 [Candidatus Binatia bacterium]
MLLQRGHRFAEGCLVFLLLVSFLSTAPAHGKLCGDDVGGRDIACGCGDVVVSDVVLGDEDPVTRETCTTHGLVVRAAETAGGLTVDLAGRTLRGEGRGAGVWVERGGAGGVRVVSSGQRATIERFRDGVFSTRGIREISDLLVRDVQRDGIHVTATGYRLEGIEVEQAGRDGLWLRGSGVELRRVSVRGAGRYGIFAYGREMTLGDRENPAGVWVERTGSAGIKLAGEGQQARNCVVVGSRKEGVALRGADFEVVGCEVWGSRKEGIAGLLDSGWFVGNRASGNGEDGIRVRGPGVVDGGGNSADRGCFLGGKPCAE